MHRLKPNQYVSLNGVRFDSTIPPGARILFAEFAQWGKEIGCFPYETKTLATMYDVSQFTIRKWVKVLVQHNLISLYIDMKDGNQQKLIKVVSGG